MTQFIVASVALKLCMLKLSAPNKMSRKLKAGDKAAVPVIFDLHVVCKQELVR